MHFLIGLLAVLLLNFKSSLYILVIRPLLEIWFANISFQSLTGSFLSLNTVFSQRKKFLILKKPNLSNFFPLWYHIQSLISQQRLHRFSSIVSKRYTAFLNLKSIRYCLRFIFLLHIDECSHERFVVKTVSSSVNHLC